MKSRLALFLWLPGAVLFAQVPPSAIVAPQGGHDAGRSLTVDWTIGDLVTETAVLPGALVTQGFHQPILTVREVPPKPVALSGSISARSSSEFSARVYPNPFTSDLTVEVDHAEAYVLEVFDPSGRLVQRTESRDAAQVIRLDGYPPAQYVLRVALPEDRGTRVFQVTKTQ